MSTPDVENALRESYQNGAFGLDTEYPNEPFDPEIDTPWARVSFLASQPRVATTGSTGDDEHVGILQIDLKYPLRTGTFDVNAKAEEVRAYYKAGKTFVYNSQVVDIQSCHKIIRGEVDGWYTVINSIAYRAFIERA